MITNKLKAAVTAIALLSAASANANIELDVHGGEKVDGSFLEVGFNFIAEDVPLIGFNGRSPSGSAEGITINGGFGFQGRFEYKGFYAEVIDDSFSDVTLGLNAYSSETSSIDIIATQMFGHIDRNQYENFETVSDRSSDTNVGVRGNYYIGDNLLQFEVVSDVASSHDGIIASAQYGRNAQYRNWNLHVLAGVRYFSDKVLDHYFGVSAEEASNNLDAYSAKQGFMPTIQLGGALPISENWVLRTSAEYAMLPESVSDSPLALNDDFYVVRAGVFRVLYP